MGELILVVDEDNKSLRELETIIDKEVFETVFCVNGQNALGILEKGKVCVFVGNLDLQDKTGSSLLQQVKKQFPDVIRIALLDSGYPDLQAILSAVNHGEVFRVITKPYQADELIAVIKKAVAYYKLSREKRNLERSFEQRNAAYKNMLRTMETRLAEKKEGFQHLKKFFMLALAGVSKEMACDLKGGGRIIQQCVTEIVDDYFATLPSVREGFALISVSRHFSDSIRKYGTVMEYNENIETPELHCFGNVVLLNMIMSAVVKLLGYTRTGRRFKARMSAKAYERSARLNTVIELGHVGGVNVPDCSDEILLQDNLQYYVSLLSHIGQLYRTNVTYTYVSQNYAVITIEADLDLFDADKAKR